MKKELNKGLLVLVVILGLLVVGLSSYLIYNKVVDKNDKIADKLSEDYSKVVGRYTGSFKNADQWMSCDIYRVIEIKENGTYVWIDYSDCSNETYDISVGRFEVKEDSIILYDEKGNMKLEQTFSEKLDEIKTPDVNLTKVDDKIVNHGVDKKDFNEVLNIIGISTFTNDSISDFLNVLISKNNYKEDAERIFSLYAGINDIKTERSNEEKCKTSVECTYIHGVPNTSTILKSDANRIKELYNFSNELDDFFEKLPEYDEDYLYTNLYAYTVAQNYFSIKHDAIVEYVNANSYNEIKVTDKQIVTEFIINTNEKNTKEQEVTYLFKKNSKGNYYLYSVEVK